MKQFLILALCVVCCLGANLNARRLQKERANQLERERQNRETSINYLRDLRRAQNPYEKELEERDMEERDMEEKEMEEREVEEREMEEREMEEREMEEREMEEREMEEREMEERERQERELKKYKLRKAREYQRARRQGASNATIQNCVTGDIVFVVDSSGSIGITHWTEALQFIVNVVAALPVGPLDAQIAMVTFGNRAHVILYLNNYTTAAALDAAILATPFLDQNTNTSGGIWLASTLLATANGGRSGVPKMMIVITDGVSTYDHNLTIPYANAAKAAGTMVVAVGVGNQTDPAELTGIAGTSSTGQLLFFQATNYDMLTPIENTLQHAACRVPIPANATGTAPAAATAPAACGPAANVTTCPTISCSNSCQYGFNSDNNGCLTCDCSPPPVVCPTATG